jgi:hypothetical protein
MTKMMSSKRLDAIEIAGFDEEDDAFDDEDLLSLDSSDFVFVGAGSTPNTLESETAAVSLTTHLKSVGRSGWDDTSADLRTQNVPPRSIVEAASLRHRQKAARLQETASRSQDTDPKPVTRAEVSEAHYAIPIHLICRHSTSHRTCFY